MKSLVMGLPPDLVFCTASPRHHLLVRRHVRTGELAFQYCFVPEGQPVTLARLIRAAGLHWPAEEDFVLQGSSARCMTLHQLPGGGLLQHTPAAVVLVVVADQKPGP